jgi:hypothetical protein
MCPARVKKSHSRVAFVIPSQDVPASAKDGRKSLLRRRISRWRLELRIMFGVLKMLRDWLTEIPDLNERADIHLETAAQYFDMRFT